MGSELIDVVFVDHGKCVVQSYHMTSEGEALRPEEECAKHSKASH